MFRRLSRPLGVVVLAALAAAPVVRALCAWECAVERVAHAAAPAGAGHESSHCTPPAGDPAEAADSLTGTSACSSCAATLPPTVRAAVRTDAGVVLAGLSAPSASVEPLDIRTSTVLPASPLTGCPPLRAPYPLRI